jgi:lysophospholipase L1-like esterase
MKHIGRFEPRNSAADATAPHPWSRYVAIGDSFTEGVGDPEERCAGGLRGWADRVAEELSAERKDFAYANLAIRGLLLDQILDQQMEPALELKPDLITLSAGGNDLVFHRTDPDKLAGKLEAGVERLSATGATIMLFAGPDWRRTPILGRSRSRIAIFNENIRIVAATHHCLLVDLWTLPGLRDPQMWDPDRLHFSPLGHHTIAMQVLDTLQVQHSLQPLEPKALPHSNWRDARAGDLAWARNYFLPWAWQRVTPQRLPLPLVHDHPAPEPLLPKRPVFAPVYAVRTVAVKAVAEFLA